MKILVVIAALNSGGTQRVLQTLSANFIASGHAVTILCLSSMNDPRAVSLDKRVELKFVGQPRRVRGIFKFSEMLKVLGRIRCAIKDSAPDVVLSLIDQTNVFVLLATAGMKIPVIVSERTYPTRHTLIRTDYPKFLRSLVSAIRAIVYLRADGVVVQCERSAECFPRFLKNRIKVIPNPVPRPILESRAVPDLQVPAIITLGRLAPEKRYDLLIAAFASAARRFPDWHLYIFGEGPLGAPLIALRDGLKLSARVHFPGVILDPSAALEAAEIFALTSEFEGFPNALCEAMACGCAVIATDCKVGPSEIIRDGVDGMLVPVGDVEAIAAALTELMENEAKRRAFGENAREICERFKVEKVTEQWLALFRSVGRAKHLEAE